MTNYHGLIISCQDHED